MATISDTLTLGLILVLIFGSVCLYLFTRIQQSEAKINLLEGLLLDIKMSNELTSYPDVAPVYPAPNKPLAEVRPFTDETDDASATADASAPATTPDNVSAPAPAPAEQPSDNLFMSEATELDSDVQGFDQAFGTSEDLTESSLPVTQVGANYEAMTLKELQSLAKQRNITGASSMRRAQIITALRTSDRSAAAPVQISV